MTCGPARRPARSARTGRSRRRDPRRRGPHPHRVRTAARLRGPGVAPGRSAGSGHWAGRGWSPGVRAAGVGLRGVRGVAPRPDAASHPEGRGGSGHGAAGVGLRGVRGSPPRADTASDPEGPGGSGHGAAGVGLRGVRGVAPPGRYCEPPRRTRRVRAWRPGLVSGGSGGSPPRADTASHPEGPGGSEHGATPGGYGGKPPGVAFIGVPTGARNAGSGAPTGDQSTDMNATRKPPGTCQDPITSASREKCGAVRLCRVKVAR